MEEKDIITAWFKITEAMNIDTSLHSFCCCGKKKYRAIISVGVLCVFNNIDTDIMKAMERTINQYSQWVLDNERKQR